LCISRHFFYDSSLLTSILHNFLFSILCILLISSTNKTTARPAGWLNALFIWMFGLLLEPVFTTVERRLSGLFSAILRLWKISLSDKKNPRPSGIPGYEYRFLFL